MPVPIMLAITIEHAVKNPMVRFGGADLAAADWVSVVIRRKFYSTFFLENAEIPKVHRRMSKTATRARGASRPNLDYRAVRCNAPEFLDLFVGNCDATGGPIFPAMKRADPAATILKSVNHDVRTRRNAFYSRTLVIFIRRITNVQREMEAALWISAIDLVHPFRRFHVAFFVLRT